MAEPITCNAHSGLITWIKINTVALTAASGLFSYSVFIQAPDIKVQMVKEDYRVEKDRTEADRAIADRLSGLEHWRSVAEVQINKSFKR